ncbi:MAG: hypothetical protein JWO05_1903 [Gemmatimonadetes bacterium]|nr:hypothetical protein [Gemmatimonadota bacterium]
MKRFLATSLVLVLSCGGDSTSPRSDLSFSPKETSLHVSEALVTELQGSDTVTGFTWTSSNTSVATVVGTDGRAVITPVSKGLTTIQAKRGSSSLSLSATVVGSCDTVRIALPFLRQTAMVRAAACAQARQYFAVENTTSAPLLYKLNIRNYNFGIQSQPVELFGGTVASASTARGTPISFVVAVPANFSMPFSVSTFGATPSDGTYIMDAASVPSLADCTRVWTIVGSSVKGALGVNSCFRTIAGTSGQFSHDFVVNAPAGASVLVRVVANGFEPALEWRDFTGKPVATAVAAAGVNTVTYRFFALGGMHLFTLGTLGLGQSGTYTLTIEN